MDDVLRVSPLFHDRPSDQAVQRVPRPCYVSSMMLLWYKEITGSQRTNEGVYPQNGMTSNVDGFYASMAGVVAMRCYDHREMLIL